MVNSYATLLQAVVDGAPSRLPFVAKCEAAFGPVNCWLRDLLAAHGEKPCRLLLSGALSSSVEVVSAAYLGLMRHSIFSLRTHYELSLAWLYYRDHPVEWSAIERGREQAILPAEAQKYLRHNIDGFESRWNVLNKSKTRKWDDPYKIMSAFVHGGYLKTLPNAEKPTDIVFTEDTIKQLPTFIEGVSEYLGDSYVCAHQHNWESLPDKIKQGLNARLENKGKATLGF